MNRVKLQNVEVFSLTSIARKLLLAHIEKTNPPKFALDVRLHMQPMKQLFLFEGPRPTEDERLLAFLALMGIPAKTARIEGGADLPRIRSEFEPGTCCLAMSPETLGSLKDGGMQELADGHFPAVLIFGWNGSKGHEDMLAALTASAVAGVEVSHGTQKIELPKEAGFLSGQLAGQGFSWDHCESLATFKLRNGARDAVVILTANERPIFFMMNIGSCQVFLLTGPIPDIHKSVRGDRGIEDEYVSLIPLLIFLRACFQQACWHGAEKTGRLIIDDPLLSKRYGYLDYNVLLRSMDRYSYGTSIAFIPWNYWRTSRSNVSRLLGDRSRLTICIHGCDHTNREFETQSTVTLERKAGLAMRRMEQQRRRTGAEFEEVMVFPQGRFSGAAITALRTNNYLAAVNTTCFPTDHSPDDLKVEDFLWPAVTRYNGFPIFHRRYPRRLFDFAFDLFLGKPALVVEHHEYFRRGCETLEEFVAELRGLEPELTWPALTTQLKRSCLRRKLLNSSAVEVRFFTRRFELFADTQDSGEFLLSKYEPDPAVIERVLVDGKVVPFWFDQDFLKIEASAEPGRPRSIEIVECRRPQQPLHSLGFSYNTRVLIRRGLSEFRDNTLARHDGMFKAARKLAKTLKLTGDA